MQAECPGPDPPRPPGLGLLFVVTGLLPVREAWAETERIAPILLFPAAVIVAARPARRHRRRPGDTPCPFLATLLWFEWCRRREVRVPMVTFVLTGTALVVTCVTATVGALLLTA